ncbi:4a-hydroxytetrahydrobiopterin dehydratase [Streptomyces sp. TR06-5]|uniref:4a-hydroxytetrahydrobiopterin dehydratase n=1 Tax=unclassified Streptomyces TaxID=2593676 RepID=UPI00399F3894
MAPEPLSPQQLDEALAELPGWQADGDHLSRTYSLPRHTAVAAMAVHVATLQDELNHHSEMTLGYRSLGITMNTHSVGGRITELDTTLARRIAGIAAGHGAT